LSRVHDRNTVNRLTVGQVPADGFWSISLLQRPGCGARSVRPAAVRAGRRSTGGSWARQRSARSHLRMKTADSAASAAPS